MKTSAADQCDVKSMTTLMCDCDSCLLTRAQTHPHEHGHAHLGRQDHKPGESLHMDNSGPFAWGLGGKKYRLFGTD